MVVPSANADSNSVRFEMLFDPGKDTAPRALESGPSVSARVSMLCVMEPSPRGRGAFEQVVQRIAVATRDQL